jgi:hypothetical protein
VTAAHHIEGVLEVDLKETQRGVLVLIEGVTERMCYDLYSSFATHSIVLACEGLTNFRLACDAETLADEATNGVPHASGRTAVADFSRAIETPPAMKGIRNSGADPDAN